jgi:hypothetical protein
MKNIIKFLSSMKLTAVLVILLIVILMTGSFLTRWDDIYNGFKEMNDLITLDWFLNIDTHNTLIVVWFIVLCCVAVMFGINLVLCTWDNLLKVAIKRKTTKSIVLFTVHVIFIAILLMHAFALLIGFKHGNVVLSEGSEYVFQNNYTLRLDKIHYIDNPALLKQKKKSHRLEMTLDKFHYKDNYASLSLEKDGKELISGNASIFSPVFGKGLQLTVDKFIIDKKTGNLCAKITITKNPLTWPFFLFYALGILSISIFLVLRWKQK